MNALRSLSIALVAALLATAFAPLARAEDKKEDSKSGGVTGTWTWSFQTQNGQTRETTLKLKQDGEKVTGTVSGRNNQESEITDGKFKDGEVSFKVVRKFNDREFTSVYKGKLEGDTIKGKIEMTGGDQTRSRDWEAKRQKAEKSEKSEKSEK